MRSPSGPCRTTEALRVKPSAFTFSLRGSTFPRICSTRLKVTRPSWLGVKDTTRGSLQTEVQGSGHSSV